MDGEYARTASLFKALADANRLMIVEMISCGELCACRILEKLGITQPTLSHHMKTLCGYGLVSARKEGKWMYYTLNKEAVCAVRDCLSSLTAPGPNCICGKEGSDCER